MSRLAKKPIVLPEGVSATLVSGTLTIKGPKGELSRTLRPDVTVLVKGNEIQLSPRGSSIFARALSGTYASHIKNMILGVVKGYEKKLLIEGTGYRFEVAGKDLVLNIGFSHPVRLPIPEGIKLTLDKTGLTISGIDKELVGQFSAEIRSWKKPEPYKGKGIRYETEVVVRKQGKRSAATAA